MELSLGPVQKHKINLFKLSLYVNHSSVIFQNISFFLHSWYFQRWELNVEVVFEHFFDFRSSVRLTF